MQLYSMCSLVVSVLDSSAVDPRSNPGSGSALLMSKKSQAVYYYGRKKYPDPPIINTDNTHYES